MFVGIYIGSRTIKAAAIKDGQLLDYQIAESGLDPHRQSLEMIKKYHPAFDKTAKKGLSAFSDYCQPDSLTIYIRCKSTQPGKAV